jgi:hypothetical protein
VKVVHVLSLGAGIQSTKLALDFEDGRIRYSGEVVKLDAAIFADTGGEPRAVYQHLEWLCQTVTKFPILIRNAGNLERDLRHGKNSTGRFASIPAYTGDNQGNTGILPRQCTAEYKTDVIARTIRHEVLGLEPRQRIPRSVHIWQYVGMSFDEAGRAKRVTAQFINRQIRPRFPLIDIFATRADCITDLVRRVPHKVPRSACKFCPYKSDAEWWDLKTNQPEDWNEAVSLDHALRSGIVAQRGLNQSMYLHRSCQPLDLVQLDTRPKPRDLQLSMSFVQECEGMCGV